MTATMDMTQRKGLMKNLLIFIAPLMLTGILQLLYTASDLIICGSFGPKNSTAAISGTSSLINLIVNSFLGIATGANVLMAQCFGAENKEKGQRVVYTSMILSVALGVTMGLVGFLCSRYFLVWMDTPEDVIELSTEYLSIYFIGVPFTMIYNFGSALLRAIGDTKKPFIFLTVSGVVNILLNLLFVIVFNLGVAGVAICTSVSQFCAALMVVLYIKFRKGGFFRFNFKEIRFYGREAKDIARIGIPAGLQAVIFSLSNVIIQSSINSLGSVVMGGNGAAASLEGFVYTAMNSCAQGALTFISANYGAMKKKNIPVIIGYTLILSFISWAVLTLIILLLKDQLLGLYVKSDLPGGEREATVAAGAERIVPVLSTYFLCSVMEIFAFSLRAIGYSVLPTVVSALGACGFRILWVYCIFPLDYFHNLKWLSISYPISWVLTAAVQFILFMILFHKLKFPQNTEQPKEEPQENCG